MSSTLRPVRSGLDAYYTPDSVARDCIATLGNLRGLLAWEPHAGGGAFVRALVSAGAVVTASDIAFDAGVAGEGLWPGVGCHLRSDFLTTTWSADWIVGNPPFNDAEAHVRHALSIARVGVGFLLRLAFLESVKRAPLWAEHPPAEVHVFSKRPSFMGGATDSAAYGWFVWRRGYRGEPVLRWLQEAPR